MYRQLESEDLSRSQFDAARLAFFQLLRRKRMSPQFVERHGEDLFAQACFEYSRQIAEGRTIHNPVAWIVTCGWHRTVGLLETRDWRPRLVSIESVAEPVEEADAGPEETFLAEDRRRKVREAVEGLPRYQRQLLALSYFEGESVREAARRLRWTASKAQRAHEAARKRIEAILDVESIEDLEVDVGLYAFLSLAAEHGGGHVVPAGFEAVLDSAHRGVAEVGDRAGTLIHLPAQMRGGEHAGLLERFVAATPPGAHAGRGPLRRVGDLGRRLLMGGGGDAGLAASAEGGGRLLEVCKGLAVCALGGGALTGALIGGGHHPARPVAHRQPVAKVAHHEAHITVPRRVTAPADIVPSAPAPRGTAAKIHSPESTSGDHPATAEVAHKVESAAPAPGTVAAHHETQEAKAEEQFRDFDTTEAGGGGSSGASSGSVADAATTPTGTSSTATSTSSGGETNPKRRSEEAAAAKEFHGLLE